MTTMAPLVRILCIHIVASLLFWEKAASFSIQPSHTLAMTPCAAARRMSRRTSVSSTHLLLAASSEDEEDNSSNEEESQEEPTTSPPPPPQQSSPPPATRPLDPLIASLTRMDPETQNAKTVSAPIFGEIPLDGGLVVLIPAVVIGLLGFIMSIYVLVNSQDAIVDSLTQLSEDVSSAAVSKTNSATSLDGSCRGLCSSQEEDLQNLKVFMEGLSKPKQ